MKKDGSMICLLIATVALCALFVSCSNNSGGGQGEEVTICPDGKALYRPKEFQGQNWNSDTSRYSYTRMACTDNLAIFWEKGFGPDLSTPPALEGQPMSIDLENLKKQLERFYVFYRDTLKFVHAGSNCDKYRMLVMLQYSLEATAYGGDYDGVIGAFWATPCRLQDRKLNCVAHELGHSFQSQLIDDGEGVAWGGSGFFEMCSQWMLWNVNPHWVDDENYHWQAFRDNVHKAFLHGENIYRSPYVLEYWSERQGLTFIADLFRQGKEGEDPAMTYMRVRKLSQKEFCDEMFDACRCIVNFNYKRVFDITRTWANSLPDFAANMEDEGNGWHRVKKERCPENYGFNAIHLDVPQAGSTVTAEFEGLTPTDGSYEMHAAENAGWRYGFMGVTKDGKSVYGDMGSDKKGSCSFTPPADAPLAHLWFVVMGAPTAHEMNPWGDEQKDSQWPYRVKFAGSAIK